VIVDARTVADGSVIEADVCIVGAGAAGITIARELRHRPLRVALLESGGLQPDDATQSLYAGETRGVPYFPLDAVRTRTRYFGGTTNEWAGECRPLDALDFEPRAWVAHSGWPIRLDDLLPFYAEAQRLCQLGPFGYGIEDWPWRGIVPRVFPHGRLRSMTMHLSPPTRFAEAYGEELRDADSVTIYLGANAVEIETATRATDVRSIRAACLSGPRFRVRAARFVLAAGGIENARLLLMSRAAHPRGVGNAHDQVGRHFMEHLYLDRAASILVPRGHVHEVYTQNLLVQGHRVRGLLGLTPETQRRDELTNFAAVLDEETARQSWQWLRAIAGTLRAGRAMPAGTFAHLRSAIPSAAAAVAARAAGGRRPRQRRLLVVKNVMEQAPNPDSRVLLSAERDPLGCPRVILDWRLSAIDRHTAHRAHVILGEEMARAGLGRLRSAMRWPAALRGARHHMGTTRMHADPRRGVVDADCRVHGIANLYVAGSSVFPTSGSANPTLTIVALAVRLARHVARGLGA
jgi:choline dehydrogenase-like flavoprotein